MASSGPCPGRQVRVCTRHAPRPEARGRLRRVRGSIEERGANKQGPASSRRFQEHEQADECESEPNLRLREA